MKRLEAARRRLREIEADCNQLASEADHKSDARAWRAVAAIAAAGLAESAQPTTAISSNQDGTGGAA